MHENGTSSEIESLPYRTETRAGEIITIENNIPLMYAGYTMSFLTADENVKVTIDDVVVYEVGTGDKRSFGHTPGSVWNFVDIPENMTQGRVKIQCRSPYNDFAGSFKAIVQSILQLLNVVDYMQMAVFSHLIISLSEIIIMASYISAFVKVHNKRNIRRGQKEIIQYIPACGSEEKSQYRGDWTGTCNYKTAA